MKELSKQLFSGERKGLSGNEYLLEDLVKRGVSGGSGIDDDTDDDEDGSSNNNHRHNPLLPLSDTDMDHNTNALLQGYQQRQQQRELDREALRRQTRASASQSSQYNKGADKDIFQLSVDSHDVDGSPSSHYNNLYNGNSSNGGGSGGNSGDGSGGGSLGGIATHNYPTYPRPAPATWTSAFLQLLSPTRTHDRQGLGLGLDRHTGLFAEEEEGGEVDESIRTKARARDRGSGLGLGAGPGLGATESVDTVGGGDSPGGTNFDIPDNLSPSALRSQYGILNGIQEVAMKTKTLTARSVRATASPSSASSSSSSLYAGVSSPTNSVLEELSEEEVFGRPGLGGVGVGVGASSPGGLIAGGSGLGPGPGTGVGGTHRKGAKALAAGLKQRLVDSIDALDHHNTHTGDRGTAPPRTPATHTRNTHAHTSYSKSLQKPASLVAVAATVDREKTRAQRQREVGCHYHPSILLLV